MTSAASAIGREHNPGDSISIKRGDNTSLSFYRSHCVKDSWSRGVTTWCGITLANVDVKKSDHEQVCDECRKAIMAVPV